MSILEQMKLRKALEDLGRREIMTKEEADRLLLKALSSVEATERFGVGVDASRAVLEMAELSMASRNFREALLHVRNTLETVDSESQSTLIDNYARLRQLIRVDMIKPSEEIMSLIEKGERAISVSIPEAVGIYEELRPAIREYLLSSLPVLKEKIAYALFEEQEDERLRPVMEAMMAEDGEPEAIHAAINATVDVVRMIILENKERLRAHDQRISRLISSTYELDIFWTNLGSSFRNGEYEAVRDDIEKIVAGLDSILSEGLPGAIERAKERVSTLIALEIPVDEEYDLLEQAKAKFESEPFRALDDYEELMARVVDKESSHITDMIHGTRDMITVGRHLGVDLSDIIVSLDEVRSNLRRGDLRSAVNGVESVKSLLQNRMGSYRDLEGVFLSLSTLLDEVEEYKLDLDEPLAHIDEARLQMQETGLDAALAMIQESIDEIHGIAREHLGAPMIRAQMSLQTGFRIDANVCDESNALGGIYEEICQGKYKGAYQRIEECERDINKVLRLHAREHLNSFLREIEERDGFYDVKKMRLQVRGAEKLLSEGSPEESYRIIWTARRQLLNLDIDALEENLGQARRLVSTGEAVEVDVSDLKRIMYSFRYDGGNVDLETIAKAGELIESVRGRIYESLLRDLEAAHLGAYRARMAGYQSNEQLDSLRRGFDLLEKGEFRPAYGALKEAEIGLSIQVLVHDEVYERLLRINRIVREEDLPEAPLTEILNLFHEGRYRDADVESKKLLRTLIEKGLRSAAADIMEQGMGLVKTADRLGLQVLSLRESVPQAQFFLENEDYRNASSLIEKAMRTGRAETSRALQSRSSAIRPRIGQPFMNGKEEAVCLDMLANTRSDIEAARYDVAANILLHLEEDLAMRKRQLERCRASQADAREQLGVARMLGLDTGELELVFEESKSLLREGKLLLSHGASERMIDRIGELVSLRVMDLMQRVRAEAELEGICGPDLDRSLANADNLFAALRERRFHYAKEAEDFLAMRLDSIRIRKESMAETREDIVALREELEEGGMSTTLADDALRELDTRVKAGDFSAGALGAYEAHLDLKSAMGLHRDVNARLERLREVNSQLPSLWDSSRTLDAARDGFAEDLRTGDQERAMLNFLMTEGDMPMNWETRRQESRLAMQEAERLLLGPSTPQTYDWDDQRLQDGRREALDLIQGSLSLRLRDLESAIESSRLPNEKSRELLKEGRHAFEHGRHRDADRKISLAAIALGRDESGAELAIKRYQDMQSKVESLRERGYDVGSWERFLAQPPAHRIGVDRKMSLIAKSVEEDLRLEPLLEVERDEDSVLLRNLGPGIARDIRVANRTIAFLGIGQSSSLELEPERELEVSYASLTGEGRKTLQVAGLEPSPELSA